MQKLKDILAKPSLDDNDIAFINANRRHLTDEDNVRLGYKEAPAVVEAPKAKTKKKTKKLASK